MDNLFSDDPMFRRTQYKKLSDNVREWQQEISAMVAEKLPKDLGVTVTVVFQDLDDEKGYGYGTAIAKSGDNSEGATQIGLPLIIKAWHLAPLDMFFADGKLYPLTDDNLAKMFYQNSLGVGVAPQKPPPNMADDAFAENRIPPLGGKYSYSSPLSMVNLLGGTLGSEDIRLLKQAVAAQPGVLASYHRRATFDVLKKYAADAPALTGQDDLNKERAQAVFTIKKDGPDVYRLYTSSDEVFDPVLITTNRQGVRGFLDLRRAELQNYEKDPLTVIDQVGHFTLEPPATVYGKDMDGPPSDLGVHKNPFVFDPKADDRTVVQIADYGRYGVRDRDGVLAKGWVIPNVVNFDGGKVDTKLFLGKALASIQARFAGIPLPDDPATGIEADRPEPGKIGTLIYRDGKDVFATVPFQVTSVTVHKSLRSIGAIDYKGNVINLIISPTIDGIVKLTDADKSPVPKMLLGPKANYIVSAKLAFVRMPRLCQVSEAPDDFKRITAAWLDTQPVKVAAANGRYVFRSGRLQKYAGRRPEQLRPNIVKAAFDFNALPRHEADFLLATWGLPGEKRAQVLDGVRDRLELQLHHLRTADLPGPTEKLANPQRDQVVAGMRAPIAELLKIAANLEDAQTVDSVLSLGFVNPENVARFASAKPMLWETCHMLANLLLASRLGMEDIPEEAVRSALGHMQRTIDGLSRLKMLEQQKIKKVAAAPAPRHVGGRLLRDGQPIGIAR
ncbi:MAG: hypothetical protein KBF21_07600 [Thermoanaerobaculia bacterium]|nr:hypothetical protein [Thermoanaerobaculia bacterium]